MPGVTRNRPDARTTTSAPARVWRVRVARGACWVIAGAAAGAVALVLLDAVALLPGWLRGLGLAAWATGVGLLAWRVVIIPWLDRRRKTGPDLRLEASGGREAAAAAALALVVCLLAGSFVPGAAVHLRRVALPWQRPPSSPHRVVVTSAAPVIPRGGSVTLTAYLESTAPLPATAAPSATFVIRDRSGGGERRLAAAHDGTAAFHVTRVGVASDFDYRFESGGAVSDWFTVTVLDPVELADDSTVEVLPPRYAPAAPRLPPSRLGTVTGHVGATAEFRLRFTRPAADVFLEFRTEGGPLEITRAVLAPDRASATAALRLKQSGTVHIVTLAERDGKRLRTETSLPVQANPDRPPQLLTVRGVSPRPVLLRPADTLRVEFTASDDLGVGTAVLEWLGPGRSDPVAVPIKLEGATTTRANGSLSIALKEMGREGDTIRYRLRLADTRRLDDPEARPQEVRYPEGNWATVRLVADAPALEPQLIRGRHSAVHDSLTAALTGLRSAGEAAAALRELTDDKADFAVDHAVRLDRLRESLQKTCSSLEDAAREAALEPESRPLATAIDTIRAGLATTDESLRSVPLLAPGERGSALAAATHHLGDAGERVSELIERNDDLARDRIETDELARLAADLSELSEKAGTLPAEDSLRQFSRALQQLRSRVGDSRSLRSATDLAKRIEFDQLTGAASELAGRVHDLDTAVRDLWDSTRAALVTGLVSDQKRLADRAAAILERLGTAARLGNGRLPHAEALHAPVELLAGGKNLDALTELETLAATLDALASAFEKAAEDRTDPKLALRQLAHWQDDLLSRLRTLTGGGTPGAEPATRETLPATARSALRAEQAALRETVAALRVAAVGGDTRAAHTDILEHLERAERLLGAGQAEVGAGLAEAEAALKAAVERLNRLADRLPSMPERLTRTRPEFDKLFRRQETLANEVERVMRMTDPATLPPKLAALAERQRQQIAAVQALDLPGHEDRQLRLAAAVTAATDDLATGTTGDVLASQAWVKREFERLRCVLFEATPPPDRKASDLAARLAALTASAETLGPQPTRPQLEALAAAAQDVFRQLATLPRSPEIASLWQEAQDTARLAEIGFRDGSPPAEVVRRLKAAAERLAALAGRMNGTESDLDRVRRLAANRRAATATAPGEAARQLAREAEELLHTRVGPDGEARKKRLLGLYTALKDHPKPESQAGLHAALAEALDELAGVMADRADLTHPFDPQPDGGEPAAASAFLPSRASAATLRRLALDYRSSRRAISELPSEVERRLKPTSGRPLSELAERQQLLAREVAALVTRAGDEPPADLAAAAALASLTADRLRDGAPTPARPAAERVAELLRQSGHEPLAARQAAILTDLAAIDPPGAAAAARQLERVGEIVNELEKFAADLEARARDAGDDEATRTGLTTAAQTLRQAGKLLGESARKLTAGRPDDAATSREQAEALLRAVAGQVAGLGPSPTTLPTLDREAANLGAALRAGERALRDAVRDLGVKPDPAAAARAAREAAAGLNRAVTLLRERFTAP
jgi:hypothetical protein